MRIVILLDVYGNCFAFETVPAKAQPSQMQTGKDEN